MNVSAGQIKNILIQLGFINQNNLKIKWELEYGWTSREENLLRKLPFSKTVMNIILDDEWNVTDKTMVDSEIKLMYKFVIGCENELNNNKKQIKENQIQQIHRNKELARQLAEKQKEIDRLKEIEILTEKQKEIDRLADITDRLRHVIIKQQNQSAEKQNEIDRLADKTDELRINNTSVDKTDASAELQKKQHEIDQLKFLLNYSNPRYKNTEKRRKLTKIERKVMWNRLFESETEDGKCMTCKQKLYYNDYGKTWQDSHIISHHNGGIYQLVNLTVQCNNCNGSMQDENLPNFLIRHGLRFPPDGFIYDKDNGLTKS